jgi:uncharacterized membrane protein (DUF441 family)
VSKITFVLWWLITALVIFITGAWLSGGFLAFQVAEAWLLTSLIGGAVAAYSRKMTIQAEKEERERCSR